MKKKWLVIMAGMVLAIGLLSGCSGGEPSDDTMLQEPASGVTEGTVDPATEAGATEELTESDEATDAAESEPATAE